MSIIESIKSPQDLVTAKGDHIEIYAFGACSNKTGTGGYGIVVLNNAEVIFELSDGVINSTSNRMEMAAVIKALIAIRPAIMKQRCRVTVYTDSKYIIEGITEWLQKWEKAGWETATKKIVKNRDLWEELDVLSSYLLPNWQWVKNKSGNPFHERCATLRVSYFLCK